MDRRVEDRSIDRSVFGIFERLALDYGQMGFVEDSKMKLN